MKHLVDIHVVLATADDMDFWEDDAEEAADKLNSLLHRVYDTAEDDIDTSRLENMLQFIWENWREDRHLLDIDEVDLHDWVDHFVATWDDEASDAPYFE